jgi:hypothetical protein
MILAVLERKAGLSLINQTFTSLWWSLKPKELIDWRLLSHLFACKGLKSSEGAG